MIDSLFALKLFNLKIKIMNSCYALGVKIFYL